MARAREIAVQGRFRVEPNPVVGCVLVKRNRVIGEGFHAYWGGPHAEAAALKNAGDRARGATAYVTLEPCAHRGKTAGCAQALVRAGVKTVVYAQADPNPETAGKGPALLREAGIQVRRTAVSETIQEQLAPYLRHLDRDPARPWVIAKWAMSLDGRIATRTGDSRWLTSEKTRRWTHRNLRARVDAILVGAGTVRADDPRLTNRSGKGGQPLRVVVCGRRPLPDDLTLLTDGGRTLLATPHGVAVPEGAAVLRSGSEAEVQPQELLEALHERGIGRVLIEGGGRLLGSFFDRELVDQVAVLMVPKLIGGERAVVAVAGLGSETLEKAPKLLLTTRTELGPDILTEAYVR